MIKFKDLKVGEILGESQYYKVTKKVGNKVQLETSIGEPIVVEKKYVETFLNSADQFSETKKLTKTALAELFVNNPRIVMTVAFYKQDVKKTIAAFKKEKEAKVYEILTASVGSTMSLLSKLLDNPILNYTKGELRVMKGRHYGEIDDLGRVSFTDMEVTKGIPIRVVDPRTIQYVIVNGIKYILK